MQGKGSSGTVKALWLSDKLYRIDQEVQESIKFIINIFELTEARESARTVDSGENKYNVILSSNSRSFA